MFNLYRVNILEDRLRELAESDPGIVGTVIVSIEGFVVAAYPPVEESGQSYSPANSPQVAAMAATLVALGEQTLIRLSQGSIKRLMVEGHYGAIVVYPINRQAALATMVDKQAKMGLVLQAVSRAARFFDGILEGTNYRFNGRPRRR